MAPATRARQRSRQPGHGDRTGRLSCGGPGPAGVTAGIAALSVDRSSSRDLRSAVSLQLRVRSPVIENEPATETPRRSAQLARPSGGPFARLRPAAGREPGPALSGRRHRAPERGVGQGLHGPGGGRAVRPVAPQLLPVLRREARAPPRPVRGVGPLHGRHPPQEVEEATRSSACTASSWSTTGCAGPRSDPALARCRTERGHAGAAVSLSSQRALRAGLQRPRHQLSRCCPQ